MFLKFKKNLLCNLRNETHIQILIVICEIRQLCLHFVTSSRSSPSFPVSYITVYTQLK